MNNSALQSSIQRRLEIILKKKGISKAEMARRSSLPSRTVENYFKGHTPSVDALLALSAGLHMPLDWLLGDLDPQGIPADTRFLRSVQDAATEYFELILQVEGERGGVIQSGKILTQEPNKLAAKVARNALQKFQYLSVFQGEDTP